MNDERQAASTSVGSIENRPKYVVGMDAHSRKLAISVWEWSDPWNPTKHVEIRCFDIDAMVKTYERHVPLESLTLIEASNNSTHLKEMLIEAGYRAEVVPSDAISGREKKRKVCDIQDARSLADAYMKGDIKEFVWTPNDECSEYRDIVFAYRDAEREFVRASNKIWAICNRKGYKIEIAAGKTSVKTIRETIKSMNITGIIAKRLEMLVEEYELNVKRRNELEVIMAEFVFGNDAMLALMQLPGVFYKTAFVTVAAVGDVHRFSKASKLAAYGGYAPSLNTSGEEEQRAARKGGTGKPLDNDGRRDLKYFYSEAGETVLNTCAETPLGKWGWHLYNRGKAKHEAACAVARKLLTYAYHILRGDPTPNREAEKFYRRKLIRFCGTLGKERVKELGYKKYDDFAEVHVQRIYAGLPPTDSAKTWK